MDSDESSWAIILRCGHAFAKLTDSIPNIRNVIGRKSAQLAVTGHKGVRRRR